MSLIVAVPTASIGAVDLVKPYADQIICLNVRFGPFFAVADVYKDWDYLEDENAVRLIKGKR
jgi:putative phosphoribosyl transferase